VDAGSVQSDEVKIASLLNELDTMPEGDFYSLKPIEVKKFTVPPDSVDVMRAKITETYVVDGIGEDTVELTGWVAVKHFNARPIPGETELNWRTAVVDTEFVGMEMKGVSEKFGRVEVRLDPSRPSRGQVGRIQIPELARVTLLAQLETDDQSKAQQPADKPEATKPGDIDLEPGAVDTGACVAPVLVEASMPDLGLKMRTTKAVHWYSLVETIPPVGHTASIAIEPVRMESEGREVGTLVGGKVHFREVVKAVVLNDSQDVQLAGN
jgi:hypothetical protein